MSAIDKEWQRVLANELNNNMLMDSAKGKTAFACGVGFVLGQLLESEDPVVRLRTSFLTDELRDFVDAYMATGG